MRVALVLGSGGARGYAHIGAIGEIRDRGHQIVGISGSSMGALVGGLAAAGRLDAYADWATSLTQRAVLRLLDPQLSSAGVLRAERILDAVRNVLGEVRIEDLPIPYTAVATDLIAGRSVWLQRGPLDDAIRCSIAIPGVIAPHVHDGRLLADGGILDPLPMAPIAAVTADVTIAISVNGDDPSSGSGRKKPPDDEDWLDRMWRSTSQLLDTGAARSLMDTTAARSLLARFSTPDADDTDRPAERTRPPKMGTFEVMNRTIDIAQAALARHTVASYPPDFLIEVPRSSCRSLEFHRAAEMIDIGREFAGAALDRLPG